MAFLTAGHKPFSSFFTRIYFLRISRLKFPNFSDTENVYEAETFFRKHFCMLKICKIQDLPRCRNP